MATAWTSKNNHQPSMMLVRFCFQPEKTRSAKTRCCKVRAKGWPFIWRPQWEAWKSNQPGDLGCRHERSWKVFGHFWEASFPGKVEATKKDLGGGNSSFFKCSSLLGVSMIQFNYTIFFRWVGSTNHQQKKIHVLLFLLPFFLCPKNRTLERGKNLPLAPLVDYTTPAHLGGKLQLDRGNAGENSWRQLTGGGWGFEGSFLLVAMMAFFSNLPFKNSGLIKAGVLIVLILMKAGFSFTLLIVETWQKNSCCPLFQRVVVFVRSNVERLKLHIEPVRTSSLGLWATTNS